MRTMGETIFTAQYQSNSGLLPDPNALLAISNGMWAVKRVKLCSNRIPQFSTRGAS